jgi:hypothetical protein
VAELLGTSRNNHLRRIFDPEGEGGKNINLCFKVKIKKTKFAWNILLKRKGKMRNIFVGIIKETWGGDF